MGANLGMNPSAVFTDRRHLHAQRLTDGAATLARTNQSDQGNFPGNEPVPLGEKTNAAMRRGGHAEARVVVNGESSNLSPSRTDAPSHLRSADPSCSPEPGL